MTHSLSAPAHPQHFFNSLLKSSVVILRSYALECLVYVMFSVEK